MLLLVHGSFASAARSFSQVNADCYTAIWLNLQCMYGVSLYGAQHVSERRSSFTDQPPQHLTKCCLGFCNAVQAAHLYVYKSLWQHVPARPMLLIGTCSIQQWIAQPLSGRVEKGLKLLSHFESSAHSSITSVLWLSMCLLTLSSSKVNHSITLELFHAMLWLLGACLNCHMVVLKCCWQIWLLSHSM